MPPPADVILITGSMGAGKTTLLGEASDILAALDVPHAAIDLDALSLAHLAGGAPHDFMFMNLAMMCAHYTAAGISRFLVAGAIETAAELERLKEVMRASRIMTCRLSAPLAVMERRVATRERGIAAHRYVARVAELERLLDRAHLEDVSLANDGASVTDVARQLLSAAGWV